MVEGGNDIYLSVQSKRKKKKKRENRNKQKKPEPNHKGFLIRAMTEFAEVNQCPQIPDGTPAPTHLTWRHLP